MIRGDYFIRMAGCKRQVMRGDLAEPFRSTRNNALCHCLELLASPLGHLRGLPRCLHQGVQRPATAQHGETRAVLLRHLDEAFGIRALARPGRRHDEHHADTLSVHDLQRCARSLVEVGKRPLVREEMDMHVDPIALSLCMRGRPHHRAAESHDQRGQSAKCQMSSPSKYHELLSRLWPNATRQARLEAEAQRKL